MTLMNRVLILCVLSPLVSGWWLHAQSSGLQTNEERATEIVRQMTLEEKVAYIGGYEGWYIRAVERLGLPEVRMADGPQGVRNNTRSTLYPCGIAVAATWDKELVGQMGVALGKDSRARGVHILLGPGANIYRSPLCGRNFEYFGEDPYLAGEIAASYIIGLQSQGVMANMKHFAANNQEYARHSVSSDVDERTLHEIYFPSFEKAVKKAGVASIMTSYNLLNSVHASESKYLNYDVLRDMWGFRGFVISDWNSCYSPLNVATWGVDLEMPKPVCMTPETLTELLHNGMLDEASLDRKCRHIIRTILDFEFDRRPQLDKSIPENNPYSDSVALEVSRSAVVLLKNNEGFLPLKKGNFVVCGPNADKIVTGGGSGFVTPMVSSSVADAMAVIDKRVKAKVVSQKLFKNLNGMYSDRSMSRPGVSVEIFSDINLSGEPSSRYVSESVFLSGAPVEAHEDLVVEKFSSRHTFYYVPENDEDYKVRLAANDGFRLYINGELISAEWGGDSWQNVEVDYTFEEGVTYEVVVEHYNRGGSCGLELTFESSEFATDQEKGYIRNADCVVVCLGFDSLTEKENKDRTFVLPDGQEEYLQKVLELNENVVVVLNAGGGVEMASWLPKVKAVLMAWYPGQQGGVAISEIITGKVSPSGKLPISIEKRLEDNPCHGNYYENVPRMRLPSVNPYSRTEYREGIFVGYRGYEKNGVRPLFPFGYGLSYTTFHYSGLSVYEDEDGFIVSFNVKNTGEVAAAEVAQVYVSDEQCSVVRPVKELKGFDKVYLNPGETKTVSMRLDDEAFRFYCLNSHGFVVEPGTFTIYVGSSSEDIRLTTTLTVK